MKKLILTYLIVLSVLTIGVVMTLRMVWPEHYPSLLFIIPVFYAVMLGVMIFIRRYFASKGRDASYFFMAYRMVKILLALILILVYFRVVKTELMPFSIIFMSYYLCLTAVETIFLVKEEKKS